MSSTRPTSDSQSYFQTVQERLSETIDVSLHTVGQTYSKNAEAGVFPSLNAVDTGMKAAMTLMGLGENLLSAVMFPALESLGLKGIACLPISKQMALIHWCR